MHSTNTHPSAPNVVVGIDQSRLPATPKFQHELEPAFSATAETVRSYRVHTSDAALAPSPMFSPAARFPMSTVETPTLYTSPRITSGSGLLSKYPTPDTPLTQPRFRVVSYAEHYNVCQTPGAADSDYKKIYSTPKFEDFFDTGIPHSGATPAARQQGSPGRPGAITRLDAQASFTTPSNSQTFLRSLQAGSATPALVFLSSTGDPSPSGFPVSPMPSGCANEYPSVVTDSISPSPYRDYKRKISFGTRVATYMANGSTQCDPITISPPEREPLELGGELRLAYVSDDRTRKHDAD
jgi:hypothetical protein